MSPTATADVTVVWRKAVTTMIPITTIDAVTKTQGVDPPMLNAPPELVVNRNVSTPSITSIGASTRRVSAQTFVSRSATYANVATAIRTAAPRRRARTTVSGASAPGRL